MVIIYALALHRHASDWLLSFWAFSGPELTTLTESHSPRAMNYSPSPVHPTTGGPQTSFAAFPLAQSNKAAHLSCLPQRYLILSFSTAEALFFTFPCLPEGLKGIMHPGLLWDLRCLIPTLFTWQRPLALWHSWRAWTGLVFPCVLPLHLLLVRHWICNSIF